MEINLPHEKDQSNDKEIKKLQEWRNFMEDLEVSELEGIKRDDIKSIDEKIEKLKNSNRSSLK